MSRFTSTKDLTTEERALLLILLDHEYALRGCELLLDTCAIWEGTTDSTSPGGTSDSRGADTTRPDRSAEGAGKAVGHPG